MPKKRRQKIEEGETDISGNCKVPGVDYSLRKVWLKFKNLVVAVVQLLGGILLFVTPWTAASQARLSFVTPEFAQTHDHWVDDAI